jgi:hypothetical protein
MILGIGRLSVAPYAVMTPLVIVSTLFAAPVWCGAVNRERGRGVEYCRNNSSGLLLGCWIREHKFQRFRRAWWSSTNWRDRMSGTWAGGPAKIATVLAAIGLLALIFEVLVWYQSLIGRGQQLSLP